MFTSWRDEIVLLQGSDVMLGDTVVDVQCFGQLVDVVRFISQEVDDSASIESATRSGEDVPE